MRKVELTQGEIRVLVGALESPSATDPHAAALYERLAALLQVNRGNRGTAGAVVGADDA